MDTYNFFFFIVSGFPKIFTTCKYFLVITIFGGIPTYLVHLKKYFCLLYRIEKILTELIKLAFISPNRLPLDSKGGRTNGTGTGLVVFVLNPVLPHLYLFPQPVPSIFRAGRPPPLHSGWLGTGQSVCDTDTVSFPRWSVSRRQNKGAMPQPPPPADSFPLQCTLALP